MAMDPAVINENPVMESGCCGLVPNLRLRGEEAEHLASIFKAIGHPVRLQIVALLSRFGGEVCVCDIESRFDLSQPTISHHLKVLRKAGLIDCEKRGLWVYYYARTDAVAALGSFVNSMA